MASQDAFKKILEKFDLKEEAASHNHDVDDFVWDYIQPFDAENLLRVATLFGVEGDFEEEDWAEDFLSDLIDEIRDMYNSTALLLGAFSEGDEVLSPEHVDRLFKFLGVEPNSKVFETLDTDNS